MEHLKRLKQIMSTHHLLMRDLEFVQDLELPNWCIAAGYVRNYVWDNLHGFKTRTTLNDVDILYYDSSNLDEKSEKNFESNEKNGMTTIGAVKTKLECILEIKLIHMLQ